MHGRSSVDRRTFLSMSALTSVAGFSGVSAAAPGREPGPKPTEWLVGVSAGKNPRDEIASRLPVDSVVHENETLGYGAVRLSEDPGSILEAIEQEIEGTGPLKYVEPNREYTAQFAPNDPRYDQQHVPEQINAETGWGVTRGSHDVRIAVVDQGIAYEHPDLKTNVADAGHDFVADDSDPIPVDSSIETHGTHVAGIAGARVNNETGVSGVSNSELVSVRALDRNKRGTASDVADAIEWSVQNDVDIINLSMSGSRGAQTVKNAITHATSQGVFVVAAAGNWGASQVSYPAVYREVVAVSALNPDGSFARYSNASDAVDLSAPGTNVLSTWPENGYKSKSGTSMSSPVVAGVAGLARSKWDLSPEALRAHLKNTAADVGLRRTRQGAGRIDAGNAMTTTPDQHRDGNDGSDSDGTNDSETSDDSNSKESSETDTNGDGTRSVDTEVTGSLSGANDREFYSYKWDTKSPSRIVLALAGPKNADFDLYTATGTDNPPTRNRFDESARTSNSKETLTIDNPDTSTQLYVRVDSYSGSGNYSLSFSEFD